MTGLSASEATKSTYQILGELGIEPSVIGLGANKQTIPLHDFETLFFNVHGIRLQRMGTKKIIYNKRKRWFGYESVDDFCKSNSITQYAKDASMRSDDLVHKTFYQWSKLRVPYNRSSGSYEVIWDDAKEFLDERNFQTLQHQAFNYGDKRRKIPVGIKEKNESWDTIAKDSLLDFGRYSAEMKRKYFPNKRDKNGTLQKVKFSRTRFCNSPKVSDVDKKMFILKWNASVTKRITYTQTKKNQDRLPVLVEEGIAIKSIAKELGIVLPKADEKG